jgi:hypothetical protein
VLARAAHPDVGFPGHTTTSSKFVSKQKANIREGRRSGQAPWMNPYCRRPHQLAVTASCETAPHGVRTWRKSKEAGARKMIQVGVAATSSAHGCVSALGRVCAPRWVRHTLLDSLPKRQHGAHALPWAETQPCALLGGSTAHCGPPASGSLQEHLHTAVTAPPGCGAHWWTCQSWLPCAGSECTSCGNVGTSRSARVSAWKLWLRHEHQKSTGSCALRPQQRQAS